MKKEKVEVTEHYRDGELVKLKANGVLIWKKGEEWSQEGKHIITRGVLNE